MRKRLPFPNRRLLSLDAWQIRVAIWLGAVLVGLVATFFAVASEHVDGWFRRLAATYPYAPLVITPAGLMLINWLTLRFFPGTQGSGIPQTLVALEVGSRGKLREGILSIRVVAGKIFMTLLGLGSGASIGREGPTVQIAAAVMFSVGRYLRFPPHYLQRALILGGGAAGISAAFNTPLAGIVFAIEEISRSFEEQTNGVVLTAVIIAGLTSLAILGNYSYFGSAEAPFHLSTDWVAVLICGAIGGLLGGAFSQLLISGSARLVGVYRRRPLLLAFICGLIIAGVGLLSGSATYGSGYMEAKAIITEGESAVDAGYPFYKMLATVASYISGIPGGIFAPSLSAGAGLGAEMTALLPGVAASTVIILTMVGYFTGVVQTPITAFVIVMEMTDNHDILLPLMATAFIADGASKLICRQPIYRALAAAFLERIESEQARREETAEGEQPMTREEPASPEPGHKSV